MSTTTIAPVAVLNVATSRGLFSWQVLVVVLVTSLYLPTLSTRFDFIDDGNLVYPAPPMPVRERLQLTWEKIAANFRDLGPFRPVLWAHWEIQAELFQAQALHWRWYRLLWTGFATAMFLWLLREFGIPPWAAAFTTALAMWNPWRGEVWTSLTLAEGVGMPYAILALVCAINGGRRQRAWPWDIGGILCMLAALGCKNTFAAMIPAQVLLRMAPDGRNLIASWNERGPRACLLGLTILLPIGHFILFKVNRREGNYDPGLFSWQQFWLMVASLKGALSLDLVGAGLLLALLPLAAAGRLIQIWNDYRSACLAGVLLLACGIGIYLPMQGAAGRYSMPAVWGADLLIAATLGAWAALPASAWKKVGAVGLAVGLVLVSVSSLARQDKFAARSAMLWQALESVEQNAPRDATITWTCDKGLDLEEGIHFHWHLTARGRDDLHVQLVDDKGNPVRRPELQPFDLAKASTWRLSGHLPPMPASTVVHEFSRTYQLGRGRFTCYLVGAD